MTYFLAKRRGSPGGQESARTAWLPAETSEALRERAKATQLLDREAAGLRCAHPPGAIAPYLAGKILSGYLVLGPPSLPLICSWSLLGPCPEGRSHGPPEEQEGAGGGLSLGEFSTPSGEAPGCSVFADLALQPTSTGLVTATSIYFHCHLWILSHGHLIRT